MASRGGEAAADAGSGEDGAYSEKEVDGKEVEQAHPMASNSGLDASVKKQSLLRSGSSRSLIAASSQQSRSALEGPGEGMRAEVSDSDRDDAESKCPSTKYCASTQTTTPDKLKGQDLVNYWVGRMGLQTILDGKKVGVPVHQSELAMRRLDAKQQLQLSSHLQCVQWCQVLCVHGIHVATTAQIKTALEGLSDCGVKWPRELMLHLWKLEFAKKAHRVTTETMSKTVVEEFLQCCLPYVVAPGRPAAFDWKEPRLCDIGIEPPEKANVFVECVLEKALVELCLQGNDSMEKTRLFCDWLIQVKVA